MLHPSEKEVVFKPARAVREVDRKMLEPLKRLTNKDVKEYVTANFKDIPVLIEIARCESGFRQWEPDGTVLKGKVVDDDLGTFQINAYFHEADARRLGLDLATLEGNSRYARYLYNRDGTKPWEASRECWGSVPELGTVRRLD